MLCKGEYELSFEILAWPKNKNKDNNPYQALLYDAIEVNENVTVKEFSLRSFIFLKTNSILHIHWPDVFLATAKGKKFWLKLVFLKVLFFLAYLKKVKVVWTAHNLKREGQRNSDRLARYFWPWFSKRVDGIIYMTKASKMVGEQHFPEWKNKPSTVIPHGHYKPIISKIDIDADKETIEGKIPEILFFGAITKYKNANKLLSAFLEVPGGKASLTIKGKMSKVSPDETLLAELQNLSDIRSRYITFEDKFLDDDELVKQISSAELVVFPYSDVLNSGAAIFALSVGRPILASDTALFRELQQMIGNEWVMLIGGELSGSQLLNAVEKAKSLKESGMEPDFSHFEWDLIANQTVSFYCSFLE